MEVPRQDFKKLSTIFIFVVVSAPFPRGAPPKLRYFVLLLARAPLPPSLTSSWPLAYLWVRKVSFYLCHAA